MSGDIIHEGDFVVLVKIFDSGNMKIIPVNKDATVHYGKLHFKPNTLIGSSYGAIYEITGEQMSLVNNFEDYDSDLSDFVSNKMATFKDKSQFSQEKILRKKKRRCHANIVTVMKPTLLHVNEMLFARDKIGGLRADMVAQILSLANVQNGSKCLVLDHNLGMITSAVMSRILPDGVCIQLLPDYEIMYTTRKTMNLLNIREADCPNNLLSITVRDLYKVSKSLDSFEYERNILQTRADEQLGRLSKRLEPLESSGELEPSKRIKFDDQEAEKNEQIIKDITKKDLNRINRNRERFLATGVLKQRNIDSLIIVVQHDHPVSILRLVIPFLAPSRQFVVYSDILDPLLECHHYLKANSLAVSLHLSESWMRRHQVLPDRTRPEMNVSGHGGFLLSGIKALYGSSDVVNASTNCYMKEGITE